MTSDKKIQNLRTLNESFSKPNVSNESFKEQNGRDSVQRSIGNSNTNGKDSVAPQGNFKPAAGVRVKR